MFCLHNFLSYMMEQVEYSYTDDSKIIRTLAIILRFFSSLIANFYHFMLAINSICSKDDDLQTIIS